VDGRGFDGPKGGEWEFHPPSKFALG
jgi:hypothetical protein